MKQEVPSGLLVNDGNGNTILDTNDRVTRVLDMVTIPLEKDYSYTYTNDAFIGHEPFVHFPVFNELILAPMSYPDYGYTEGTDGWLGWNSTLNATYFQLVYERVSENSIKISTRFYWGRPNDSGPSGRRIGPGPEHLRKVPVKVIIGVY